MARRLAIGKRFDALVVGAGPAGSVAGLVLARAGANVALVDKASFPRDKACGDVVGPRGVRVLEDLGVDVEGLVVGDMEVIGPTGRRVLLRASPGVDYPGYGLVVARRDFDDRIRASAIEAGAEPITGRAGDPRPGTDGTVGGFRVERAEGGGLDLDADVVIGADGALSRVGAAAGLVDERRALWGFAVRGYTASSPPLPQILFWEPEKWTGYPGYGWVFPGDGDTANVGLGVGVRGDRREGIRATRDLPAFISSASPGRRLEGRTLGGWLKMGMVGTTAARGRVLLVGDAAGLVNPLQGEGISQALASGHAAARAVVEGGPAGAAARYRAWLAKRHAPYSSATAPITAWMLSAPRVVAGVGRLLTAPGVGRAVAGGWSLYWNELLDGAYPGSGRRVAALADRAARIAACRTDDWRAVWESVGVARG